MSIAVSANSGVASAVTSRGRLQSGRYRQGCELANREDPAGMDSTPVFPLARSNDEPRYRFHV